MIELTLQGAVPHADATQSALLAEAAQRVATGQMDQATALLRGLGPDRLFLLQAYAHAFGCLCRRLSAITALSALGVFAFLSEIKWPRRKLCNAL